MTTALGVIDGLTVGVRVGVTTIGAVRVKTGLELGAGETGIIVSTAKAVAVTPFFGVALDTEVALLLTPVAVAIMDTGGDESTVDVVQDAAMIAIPTDNSTQRLKLPKIKSRASAAFFLQS